ncbi:MAG: glycosyltransferase family 2 protein, partial [Vulcanimicrobiaceae bacterium]
MIAGDAIPAAYFDVAAARRNGEAFAALFLMTNRRAAIAYEVGAQVVRTADYDRQRATFDALAAAALNVNERPVAELNVLDEGSRIALADLSRLPDALVVRSFSETQGMRELRGYDRANVARWYPARALPSFSPGARRDTVVVWAPDFRAEQTALHTFALHGLHEDIVVVCRGGEGLSARARYVDADSPEVANALARAVCVVDASPDDPSWTQALASAGMSVAATSTSGAREVADGIAVYDPWSHKSISEAVLEALSRRQSTPRETPPPLDAIRAAIDASRPQPPDAQPLVSVVIPTYNRRGDLVRVLTRLREQSYRHFEAVVVNDGGESIADLQSLDERFLMIDREVNEGPFRTLNFGISRARGEYVQFTADDDELYPDHLMRLVAALERTGASVAHGNVLIRYESRSGDAFVTSGYNCSVFCHPVDSVEVYASSPIAGNAMMVRKSALERQGVFDESFVLADQEIQIRLAEAFDFVHVPHVTAEWLVRDSGDQFSKKKQGDVLADLRRVYERHPAPGRAYVAAVREGTLRNVSSR